MTQTIILDLVIIKINLMKNSINTVLVLLLIIVIASCKKETREKIKQAKQGISNTAIIVKNAKKTNEHINKLREATPLTNGVLKSWLPESINGMKRTGFIAGQAMYVNMASIEGTYGMPDEPKYVKNDEGQNVSNPNKKGFTVSVMDGAGPTASTMIGSLTMMSNMSFEEDNERHHKKNSNC